MHLRRRTLMVPVLVAIVTVTVVALSIQSAAVPGSDIEGGILLRTLRCDQSEGLVRVSGLAVNFTQRDLRNVAVKFEVGRPGALNRVESSVELWSYGAGKVLEETFEVDEEVDVCSIKFYLDDRQITTAFRP